MHALKIIEHKSVGNVVQLWPNWRRQWRKWKWRWDSVIFLKRKNILLFETSVSNLSLLCLCATCHFVPAALSEAQSQIHPALDSELDSVAHTLCSKHFKLSDFKGCSAYWCVPFSHLFPQKSSTLFVRSWAFGRGRRPRHRPRRIHLGGENFPETFWKMCGMRYISSSKWQVTLKIFGKTHCRKGRIQVYFQSGAAEIADWECLTHDMTSRENSSKQWQEDTRPWLPASDETCPTCNKTSKACRHEKLAYCVVRLIVIAILHYDILIVKFMIWQNMMPYNDNDV